LLRPDPYDKLAGDEAAPRRSQLPLTALLRISSHGRVRDGASSATWQRRYERGRAELQTGRGNGAWPTTERGPGRVRQVRRLACGIWGRGTGLLGDRNSSVPAWSLLRLTICRPPARLKDQRAQTDRSLREHSTPGLEPPNARAPRCLLSSLCPPRLEQPGAATWSGWCQSHWRPGNWLGPWASPRTCQLFCQWRQGRQAAGLPCSALPLPRGQPPGGSAWPTGT